MYLRFGARNNNLEVSYSCSFVLVKYDNRIEPVQQVSYKLWFLIRNACMETSKCLVGWGF